jgi:tetratricopeptide (TPR) repeat protein
MNNQDIPVISLNGFIARFNEQSNLRKNRPFCFILGAGASVSSEIPSGEKLATTWLDTLYHEAVDPKLPVEEWATEASLGIKGFKYEERASFYSQLYEKRFGKDPEGGYAFLEDAMSQKSPRVGYSILAYILSETQHKVVITTNFDNLVADALSIYTETFPLVLGDQSLARYASVDVRRPLIAKIHGALGFAMRNSSDEVGELPEEWITPIKQIFAKYTPIVIGYDGNDGGLMGLLKKMPKGSINAIYWCKRWTDSSTPELLNGLKPAICDILRKHNGTVVPILGFDEMMLLLQQSFDPSPGDMLEFLEEKHLRRVADYNKHLAEISEKIQPTINSSKEPSQLGKPRVNTSVSQELSEPESSSISVTEKQLISDLDMALTQIAEKQKVLPWWEWKRRIDQASDRETKLKIINEAIHQLPENAVLRTSYGNFLQEEGRIDEAINQYKEAINLDPNYAFALSDYGEILNTAGKTDEAEIYFRRACEADPKDAYFLIQYANFLNMNGRPDEAENYFKRAVKAAPKYAFAFWNYAIFLQINNKTTEAELYFKRAIELSPRNAFVLTSLAFLFEKKRNFEDADFYYKAAIEANPKYSYALIRYALFLYAIDKDDEAKIYLFRAIEADPNDAFAKIRLAHLYFLKETLDPAFKLLSEAEALAPKEKPLQVEMLFYRLAYDKEAWPVRLKEMRDLFAAGARSPNWPLDKHIENAKGLEHPNVELLQAIANVASKGEPMSSLEEFAEWPKSQK